MCNIEEKICFNPKYLLFKTLDNLNDELGYNKKFYLLWPTSFEEDDTKLNEVITKENIKRKEQYQRVINQVTKNEYVWFLVLMIFAILHNS